MNDRAPKMRRKELFRTILGRRVDREVNRMKREHERTAGDLNFLEAWKASLIADMEQAADEIEAGNELHVADDLPSFTPPYCP